MNKHFLLWASGLGATAVTLGAFGAHTLKSRLSPDALAIFDTAIRYQFYHVFALAMVGILQEKIKNQWMHRSGILFIIGILLFSGSLYALCLVRLLHVSGLFFLGPATPVGGIFLILGWLCLFIGLSAKQPQIG